MYLEYIGGTELLTGQESMRIKTKNCEEEIGSIRGLEEKDKCPKPGYATRGSCPGGLMGLEGLLVSAGPRPIFLSILFHIIPMSCYTVRTVVLLCELNRYITHFLRGLLQVHELMKRVLPEKRAQFGLIQHVLATLPTVHTSKRVFYGVYDNTPYVCAINARKSNPHTSS